MTKPPTFCLPLQTPISNNRIKLVPWETDLHGATFIAETRNRPEIFSHTLLGPFPTVQSFRTSFEEPASPLNWLESPEHFFFAVIDKTKPPSPEDEEGELAGIVGYIFTSATNLSTEIGPVVILPRAQRSHVTSNAVGLLLLNAFASVEEGGLGLKRVQWICSTSNLASVKVAERMGFEKVGVIPWHMRLVNGKSQGKFGNGKPPPPGSDTDDIWRDSFQFTLGWDVWEEVAQEKVQKALVR